MTRIQNPPDLDHVIEALANQHRREIIHVLSLGPCSISKLAFLRNLSLPAIHKHIEVLEEGVLLARRPFCRLIRGKDSRRLPGRRRGKRPKSIRNPLDKK